VKTTDGNLYRGELRGGAFEVDGTRFPASSCVSIHLDWHPLGGYPPSYHDGVVELSDGTTLKVGIWETGFLSKKVHLSLSGHVVLFVESLGREVKIESNQIEYFSAAA